MADVVLSEDVDRELLYLEDLPNDRRSQDILRWFVEVVTQLENDNHRWTVTQRPLRDGVSYSVLLFVQDYLLVWTVRDALRIDITYLGSAVI